MRRTFLAACAVLTLGAFSLPAGSSTVVADSQRYKDEVFPSVSVASDIAYGQAIDEHGALETLRLDLYQPAGDTEPARPAFVWIHGGGFTSGDKAAPLTAEIATRFARRGYVAVSINYRLREGENFEQGDPEQLQAILDAQHDAQASVRWLRANAAAYGIDANRIAIGGTSAGAVTALQVAYNADNPGDSGNPGYPSNVSAIVDVSGAMNTASMDAGEPPALVVHGTVDATVAFSYALAIVARAQEVGVPVEFHPLEGAGHGVWTDYKEQIIAWMSDFLYRYVSAPPVGGIAELAIGAEPAPSTEILRYRDKVFDSVTVTSNIAYGQAIDEHGQMQTLRLDLYEPKGDKAPLRPAFVWIHGGSFNSGNKAEPFSTEIASRFARRGWVVVSIDYRLREGQLWGDLREKVSDAQHDAQAAVRWVRANAATYRIDPDAIAIGGHSVGAVAALHTQYNPTDPGDSGNPGYPSNTAACVDISGWMDTSLMERGEGPVLIVHGTADEVIQFSYAEDIVARAQEVGVEVEFIPLDGGEHNAAAEEIDVVARSMADFLYEQVIEPSSLDTSVSKLPLGDTGGDDNSDLILPTALAVTIALGVATFGAWRWRRCASSSNRQL
jgi:acetyl esterase/lipase